MRPLLPLLLSSAAAFGASAAAPVPPAAAPAGGAPSPAPAEPEMRLVLADEPIPQVLALMEKFTGKTILADPALPKSKISFRAQKPLTKTKTIVALESLLALNGVALTPLGEDFVKAVPSGAVAAQDTPELFLDSVKDMPPSQRVVARLFTLRGTDAAGTAERMRPFLSGRAVATVMREANAVLVTDSLANLIRLESFVEKCDRVPADRVFEIKNARAVDAAAKLKTLVSGPYKNLLRGETSIDTIERSNRLIVTSAPENLPTLEKLVAALDGEMASSTRMEIFPIRQGEALKIVQVVTQLSQKTGTPGLPGMPAAPSGEDRFSASLNLVADDRSNSIVAQGTPDDLTRLRKLIERLDVALPQVRIEATIVEVTLSEGEVSGLDSLGLGFKLNPNGSTGSGAQGDYRFGTGTATLPNSGEQAFGISGSVKDVSLATVLNKGSLKGRVKVLSSPTIRTTHNRKGTINISQAQPIVTGSTSDLQNASVSRSSVSYRDIGIKLEVTPRIGDDGLIQMEVTQVIENVAGTTRIDNNEQPLIGKREATSVLTASDREVVILAGLQSTAERKTEGKVWLLGDIPLLGALFTPKTSAVERRELIIFLKPYVVDAARAKTEPTPGLRPDALTAPDANKYIGTGIAPSPLVDTWEEHERRRAAEAAARAVEEAKGGDKLRGMHD